MSKEEIDNLPLMLVDTPELEPGRTAVEHTRPIPNRNMARVGRGLADRQDAEALTDRFERG